MTFYERLKDLVKKSDKKGLEGLDSVDPQFCNRPPTTIREVYLPNMDTDEFWCEISTALKSEFEGKIKKYFDLDEDLAGFQLRSRILGLELRKIDENQNGRGFVIVGNEGYIERLNEIKEIYDEYYRDLKFSNEFDNELNRAGFYWEGVKK